MLKVKIHSMVDLITNSSTELFVLDTDKSLEVVKDILQEAINLHNKIDGSDLKFEDVFDEPYIGLADQALDGWNASYKSKIGKGIIIRGADDNSIPYWIDNFITEVFGYSTERFHLG